MNIEITELTKHYGATRAIDGISVALPGEGRALVLIGPSGGGKSTLLRLLGGLEVPTSGDIRRNGRTLPATEAGQLALRRRNGFLFQSFNLFPHLSALENIVLPLVRVHRWQREDAIGRAREVVARFGMEDHVTKMPGELSGGQQQRIALARAMAHEPDLLLLDEPTSALDPEMKAEVLDIVAELCEAGQRIILSTHEMGFARSCADEVIFLANGRLVESGKGSALFESPQTEVVRTFLGRVMKW